MVERLDPLSPWDTQEGAREVVVDRSHKSANNMSWAIGLAALALSMAAPGCAYDARPASIGAEGADASDASDASEASIEDNVGAGDVSVDEPGSTPDAGGSLPDLEEEGCEGTLFVDRDGDGVGSDSVACDTQTDLALVEEGGDCDDGDPQKWRAVTLHPDLDLDTFTGAPQRACVGDEFTEGSEVASRPPEVSVGPARISISRGDDDDGWKDIDDVARLDGERARCRNDDEDLCSVLWLEGFALDIPDDANVLGIEVKITGRGRRQFEPVELVKLTFDGQVFSESRRLERPWANDYEPRAYGGAEDLWGGDWSPSLLNSDGFGVQLSLNELAPQRNLDVEIDHITVHVHHDMAYDCDDGDPAAWSRWSAFLDEDNDGHGVPVRTVTCLGETTQSPDSLSALDDDCFDANGDAYPGSGRSRFVDRGDGSFDYNCDGVESPQSITGHSGCTYDALTMSCTITGEPLQSLAPCGEVNEVPQCMLMGVDCLLAAVQRATSCK